MSQRLALVVLLATTGCGKLLGIDDFLGPPANRAEAEVMDDAAAIDAWVAADAPVVVADPITISGRVTGIVGTQATPLESNVIIAQGPDIPANGPTDIDGNFALVVPTAGVPVDVAVLAFAFDTDAGWFRTQLLFSEPLTADRRVELVNVNQASIGSLLAAAQEPSKPAEAFVVLRLRDAQGAPLPGVKVTADQDVRVRYVVSDGAAIERDATLTQSNGLVYVFDALAGPLKLTIDAPGRSFGDALVLLVKNNNYILELRPLPP